jgi:pyruvate/2-oxoglutarate dehydrogenase complex dihydrolipoamide acyltransferase (E2) component
LRVIYKVTVPSVSEDVEEIRVLEWHGAAGDDFQIGDLVVELETHKALVEMRAGQPGILRRILCEEGDWAKVDVPIALFSDEQTEDLPEDAELAGNLAVDFVVD